MSEPAWGVGPNWRESISRPDHDAQVSLFIRIVVVAVWIFGIIPQIARWVIE